MLMVNSVGQSLWFSKTASLGKRQRERESERVSRCSLAKQLVWARQTDRQTDRQIESVNAVLQNSRFGQGRQTDRQTDRQRIICMRSQLCVCVMCMFDACKFEGVGGGGGGLLLLLVVGFFSPSVRVYSENKLNCRILDTPFPFSVPQPSAVFSYSFFLFWFFFKLFFCDDAEHSSVTWGPVCLFFLLLNLLQGLLGFIYYT